MWAIAPSRRCGAIPGNKNKAGLVDNGHRAATRAAPRARAGAVQYSSVQFVSVSRQFYLARVPVSFILSLRRGKGKWVFPFFYKKTNRQVDATTDAS